MIYGSSSEENSNLRTFQRGQLKTSQGVSQAKPFLPLSDSGVCSDTSSTLKCFVGGEPRTNENLGLAGLQTMFLREHNRIANQLAIINANWPDDRLFFETRKIIIGVLQNIVYKEWLPTVIGRNKALEHVLLPVPTDSFYQGYDPNVKTPI
jgi:peroxidase